MAVSALTSSTSTTGSGTSSKGLTGVSSEDFMNILIKQLQMQDPFEPMTNEEMLSQISTIRELEMNTRLSNRLEQVTEQQRFGAAAALIGKHVEGKVSDTDGNEYEMEGTVNAIRFSSNGEALLELDTGETLPLVNVTKVTNPQAD